MIVAPGDHASARLAHWAATRAALDRRFNGLSLGRAACFVAILVVGWLAAADGRFSSWWVAGPVLGFLALALWHERVAAARVRARRGEAYHRQALARMDGTWVGHGIPGEDFRVPSHPYADDLDLFGRGSLFELVCTCRSAPAQERLAQWLLAPASVPEILARQEAVRELATKPLLREALALEGEEVGGRLDQGALRRWAERPGPALSVWHAALAVALALANVIALIGALGDRSPAVVPLLTLTASAVLATMLRPRVREAVHGVDVVAHQLDLLASLAARLEREAPASPRLRALHAQLMSAGGVPASRGIRQLGRLVGLLDSRRNQLFLPVAAILLWTTQLAAAVERWRHRAGPHVGAWLEAIAEWEALAALGTHAAEHPDAVMPTIAEGAPRFEATGLAHPLLPLTGRVANDVALGEAPRLYVVSGSNMSGKSTLLRAIGVNAVLAQAGAPVRATRLVMSPLAIGASFRVGDSLVDGRSRFYAEITRLRQVVDLLQGPRGLLFLLDELLSGTNSHDRVVGASAVVRHLVAQGAIGCITTHDLALAQIATDLGSAARNVHFEDHLDEAGELRFDYRLKPGIVTRSNALALMRSVGLSV